MKSLNKKNRDKYYPNTGRRKVFAMLFRSVQRADLLPV